MIVEEEDPQRAHPPDESAQTEVRGNMIQEFFYKLMIQATRKRILTSK
jgi:hypothetical protein